MNPTQPGDDLTREPHDDVPDLSDREHGPIKTVTMTPQEAQADMRRQAVERKEILRAMNERRASQGLPPVPVSE